jgi:ADP-ribose pyrophosphatase
MAEIRKVSQMTENPFVNLYVVDGVNKKGRPSTYYVASRARHIENLKLKTKRNTPDGVVIYSVYGEKKDRVVLIRQYRYAIDDYIYELPAGLVEPGEDYHDAAVRELHEETGLVFHPLQADPLFEKPGFTTIGMTDESCATVFGYASGEVSSRFAEENEEIEVVLADRKEVRRILKEENVAIICAYQMMHFLSEKEPFAFLEEKTEFPE